MYAERRPDDHVTIELGHDELVVLHDALGRAEWAEDLDVIELEHPAEVLAFTRLMLALRPHIPERGTEGYGRAVEAARTSVVSGQQSPP